MPMYEYQCRECGHRFERLVRSRRDRPSACPHCGARNPEKQFSTFSAATGSHGGTATPSCPTGTCPFARP
jgi:putative FmdB family regulatory protein